MIYVITIYSVRAEAAFCCIERTPLYAGGSQSDSLRPVGGLAGWQRAVGVSL
jgi:hypothetical protein